MMENSKSLPHANKKIKKMTVWRTLRGRVRKYLYLCTKPNNLRKQMPLKLILRAFFKGFRGFLVFLLVNTSLMRLNAKI